MTLVVAMTGDPEPDQQPHRWDDHVTFYEDVFEPLTQTFAVAAIEALSLEPQSHVLDSGAGTGGAALELARRGHRVAAIDASKAMVRRAKERASTAGLVIESLTMDGQSLSFRNASFDAALSVLGVILFPDAVRGLSELHRTVRPGGRIALITWTAPEAYELIGELRAAALSVLGSLPPRPLPAQLRFKEKEQFQALCRRRIASSRDLRGRRRAHGAIARLARRATRFRSRHGSAPRWVRRGQGRGGHGLSAAPRSDQRLGRYFAFGSRLSGLRHGPSRVTFE
jgi:SAM-dependent methyltransferase